MGKHKGATTGILLELGRGPDEAPEGDGWSEGEDGEEDFLEPEPDARPARDPKALIDGIDQNLSELRRALSEMG